MLIRRIVKESKELTVESFRSILFDFIKQKYNEFIITGDDKYYAIRYDNKQYNVSDRLPNSKTNADREDVRDFPSYNSDEYNSLESLDGTCCYEFFSGSDLSKIEYFNGDSEEEIDNRLMKIVNFALGDISDALKYDNRFRLYLPKESMSEHINIISGEDCDTETGEDPHEWIIYNAKVEKIIC